MVVLSGRHTWDQPVPPRYALLDQYSDHLPAGVGQEHWGLCADVEGLYVPGPPTGIFGPPMRLLGVEPQGRLRRALEIGKIKQLSGADLEPLDRDGRAASGWFFRMEILGWHPSTIGRGLFDIDLRQGVWEPPTPETRPIWELWWAGGPQEKNPWAPYPEDLRREWTFIAMKQRAHDGPDLPPGRTAHLDGRFVTDWPGAFCALGEAVVGPGAYFGWGLDALNDCLRGGFGSRSPFTLIWHEAETARAALGDRLEAILAVLKEHETTVHLD